MADCGLKEIGKSIITQCLRPHTKIHIDYWWCFDNNIQGLKNGVGDLESKIYDINQKIEEARLRTEILRPGVEEWPKTGTKKLVEAKTILQGDINPKAWNLISRYSMGKKAKKAAEEIAEHLNDGNFDAISDPASPPSMGSTSHRSIMDFDSRKGIEEEIIKSLKKSSVGMIGICGMGGVGKTTMAQRIRERVIEEKLFDEVVMVVVSQHIDMLKIQDQIAKWLKLNFDENDNYMPTRAYKLRMRLMNKKRKIIIFDDVWESLKLEDLGIPIERNFERCKIVLTTRSKDVCERMEVQMIIKLKILEEEEAWILFKEKAGECVEDSALLSVAKYVAAECKGLPITLVTVATTLQNQMNKSIWEDALSQLRQSNPTDLEDVLEQVYSPLRLSYLYLDSENQKELFLLCCLFPEGYDIPVEQLTLYCMGLRLFDDMRRIEEARNITYGLLDILKSRSLLIDSPKDLHVRMANSARDVAIYIGSKEKNGFLKSLNKISIESSSDVECNWMSVDNSNERIEIPLALRFPKLRLLMLLKSSYDEFSDISFEGMENLNVLSFSSTRIGSLPPTLSLLQNLRTLCLFGCEVENISVIGELTSLEVFSCNGCNNIKELPAEIGRLNCVRLLELNECRKLQRIPFGILSSLVQLEELKIRKSFDGWEAEENGKKMRNASLTELECLPKLSCLEIEISDSNLAAQEIRLSLKLFKYKIYIASKDNWFEETDYEKVMKLNLPSHIAVVGKWIQMLVRNSEYLCLNRDGSNNINLEECEDLRKLEFRNCSRVKNLVKTKDCKYGFVFPLLERLLLYALFNLEEIFDGTILLNQIVSLYHLKSVVISNCSNLRTLFSVSMARSSLLRLEVLEIQWCHKMERVFWNDITDDTDAFIEFPRLKRLILENLWNLTAFCQGVETIKFPELTEMEIGNLPKLNSLSKPKVEIGGLYTLRVWNFGDNIRNMWCDQIRLNIFNNLRELRISYLNGTRSLMSTSIAKNLVSLNYLFIDNCKEMVEVIEGDDDGKEVVDIKCLFPTLTSLEILEMLKLRRFWHWNRALELPLLENVSIEECPVIETFTLGSLKTPNIRSIYINMDFIDDQKDLNHVIHQCNRTSTRDKGEKENMDEEGNKDDNGGMDEDVGVNMDEDMTRTRLG